MDGTRVRTPAPPARAWPPWAATAARLLLGVVFEAAGVLKVGDLAQSVRAVRAFPRDPDQD